MANVIYGLVDPRTLLVRYVGLSTQGARRAIQHRHTRKSTHRENWIRSLHRAGLDFVFVILEEVDTAFRLPAAERFWIAYGRACGWPLTNITDGGDRPATTPETRAKIGAANRGRIPSRETRAKMRAAKLGTKQTPEWKAKRAAALRGKPKSEQHRRNLSQARTGRAIGPMSAKHRARIAGQRHRWERQKRGQKAS